MAAVIITKEKSATTGLAVTAEKRQQSDVQGRPINPGKLCLKINPCLTLSNLRGYMFILTSYQ